MRHDLQTILAGDLNLCDTTQADTGEIQVETGEIQVGSDTDTPPRRCFYARRRDINAASERADIRGPSGHRSRLPAGNSAAEGR